MWDVLITSDAILDMLEERHNKDLFVSECKNGSTWFQNHSRVDAWVMARSWSHPKYTGYEIKVSKSDFKSDSKYTNYLPMCNELYFVCPWNMIQVCDIPLEVGLIYVSKNESRLITRKKAVYRNIEEPIDTLKYVMICRTKIGPDTHSISNAEYWKKWIEEKSDELDMGRISSKRLRKMVDEKILSVNQENYRLEKENEKLKNENEAISEIKELLKQSGIREYDIINKRVDRVVDTIKNKMGASFTTEFIRLLKGINEDSKKLIDSIEQSEVF